MALQLKISLNIIIVVLVQCWMLDIPSILNIWLEASENRCHIQTHTTEVSMAHAEFPKMVLEIEYLDACMINI